MDPELLYKRYSQLQKYVLWTDEDAHRVRRLAPVAQTHFAALIDDFYDTIEDHSETAKIITGGAEQIARLKKTLVKWLEELFSGQYNRDYVTRRWNVGLRHVEIGLDQVYTNAALSRLRSGLLRILEGDCSIEKTEMLACRRALNKLLDLDLAIIEDAYQTESQRRRHQLERLAAIGQVAGGIAEELRTPLSVIANAAAHLREARRILSEKEVAQLERIDTQAAMIDGVVSALNTFAQEPPTETATADLATCIRQVAEKAIQDSDDRLQQERQRTLQHERLAAIGETMTALIHESRNALQRSKACLEMLGLEVKDRPEALKLVGRVQQAQDDLQRLYEEVRQFAAPVVLHRRSCDLRESWRKVWQDLAQSHGEKRQTLDDTDVATDTHCDADPFAIEQVWRNILENAIAAAPSGSTVFVRGAAAALNSHPALAVSICDQGPGLTELQESRIFEPFFTTKTKGTGLGMAIAQRIVAAHGGTIAARNSETGATIEVILPRESA